MNPVNCSGYFFEKPDFHFVKKDFTVSSLEYDQVLVKVAGCGLCHTDISFLTGAVKTKKQPPLILGHEISGTVVESGSEFKDLINKNVIIPAVLPCEDCDLCRKGRDNICQAQKMPGNDFNGGFATHIVVPAKSLCLVPDILNNQSLASLSVIADAVTTPWQSLLKSGLQEGDLAIVIGVGGIGNYMVQHCKNHGATVIAVDVDDKKLNAAKSSGASHTLNARNYEAGELKKAIRTLVKDNSLPKTQWRVFETSGTASGQNTAFSLLSFAGSVGIVGFTMEKLELRLSNIMAFDADLFGNWGCSPKHYPDVLNEVLSGKVNLNDHIEEVSLDSINEYIPKALDHKLEKRIIFKP